MTANTTPTTVSPPPRSHHETLSQQSFHALLWSMSYPGRVHPLAHAGLRAVGETLLDLETRFYTPERTLAESLHRTGAAVSPPETADYLFFATLDDAALAALATAKRGDLLYPDRAATVVVAARLGAGLALRLHGPGVAGVTTLMADLPADFWRLRNRTRHYPLGWDVVLCAAQGVAAVPRSTAVEVG